MRILTAVQAIFAIAFILFGLVALFGIGITGLLFLLPGAVFAATALAADQRSRATTGLALAVDAGLAYLAASKLDAMFAAGAFSNADLFDYLPSAAALVLIGVGVLAVVWDWRTVRDAPWLSRSA